MKYLKQKKIEVRHLIVYKNWSTSI